MTPHCLLRGVEEEVVEIEGNWVLLTGGFVVRKPEGRLGVGGKVRVEVGSEGVAEVREVSETRRSLSLAELHSLHFSYFPPDTTPPPTTLDDYPLSISPNRLPTLHLHLLKPFNPFFKSQVLTLQGEFSSWRKARGDGNCYYRAVGYAFLEHLCRSQVHSHYFRRFYMQIYLQKGAFSLDKWMNNEFDGDFVHVLHRLKQLIEMKETGQAVLRQLEGVYAGDKRFDEAFIRVLKLAAWNQLQDHLPSYSPYLLKPLPDLLTEILTDGIESEGLVFQLIADLLDVVVTHVFLPQTGTIYREEYTTTQGIPGKKAVLCLLLRPGHYDILYTLQADLVDRYNFVLEDYSGPADVDIGDSYQLYREL